MHKCWAECVLRINSDCSHFGQNAKCTHLLLILTTRSSDSMELGARTKCLWSIRLLT